MGWSPVALVVLAVVYSKALWFGLLVGAHLAFQQLCRPWTRLWVPRRRDVPPKCLQEPALGQHNYSTVNGLKFHYVEKGDRSRPLMLFVHGFPEFWYSWRFQMEEFSKDYCWKKFDLWISLVENEQWCCTHRTVSPDMRGYGDSAKPKGVASYKIDCMIEDIKAIVTGLGRKTFTIVGHDWGAVISWKFVEKYPEMVDKFIMMNGSHPSVHMKQMKTSEKQSKMSWYIFFFQLPCLPELWVRWDDFKLVNVALLGGKSESSRITEEDVEAYKYTFSKGSVTGPINYYRAAIRTSPNARGKLGDIRWPQGLYIFGDKDKFIDKSSVAVHEKLIPNLKTLIIEGANHFVQQDDPQAVNRAMRSFLGSA